jgi:hypothetical protein
VLPQGWVRASTADSVENEAAVDTRFGFITESISSRFNGDNTKFSLSVDVTQPQNLLVIVGGSIIPYSSGTWRLLGNSLEFLVDTPETRYTSLVTVTNTEVEPLTWRLQNGSIKFNRPVSSTVIVSIAGQFISPYQWSLSQDRTVLTFPVLLPSRLVGCVGIQEFQEDCTMRVLGNGDGVRKTWLLDDVDKWNSILVFLDGVYQAPGKSYAFDIENKAVSFYTPPRECTQLVIYGAQGVANRKTLQESFNASELNNWSPMDETLANWYGVHGGAGAYKSLHYMLDVMGIHGYVEEDLEIAPIDFSLPDSVSNVIYKSQDLDLNGLALNSYETDVAYIQIVENVLRITPKRNWLITGVGQDRSLYIIFTNGDQSFVSLNPSGREQFRMVTTDYNSESSLSLCRIWNSTPLRVGTGLRSSLALRNPLIADFSSVGDEPMTSAIRLPPTYLRKGEEFARAKSVAANYVHTTSKPCTVGYAYFAADLSAADEAVFDPSNLSCLRHALPDIHNGYYRHSF